MTDPSDPPRRRRPVGTAVPVDEWQVRLDRMRRVLPLPLLALSTVAAYALPEDSPYPAARYVLGIPLAAVAAVLWTVVTIRPGLTARSGGLLAVFAVHSAVSAVLVAIHPTYGVFAYVGFLFAYGLGPRLRIAGFTVTALVVSASLTGGYPTGALGQTLGYLLVAAVMVALVLNTAIVTSRALEQNRERGRMIEELAEANRRLAASMAENAALHEQVVEQAREAGVLDERQRLAGEIHDTLAQGLTGIVAQLEAAEHTRHRPAEAARHLGLARDLARDNLTEARRSVRALRPEQLEAVDLPAALAELARSWSERSGTHAEVETTGEAVRAGEDVEAALFRVAQEALSNVAKHAGAGRVRLTLTYLDGTLLLDVADDGAGFDPAGRTGGYGLAGMRHRMERVGGALTVESTPGGGTTLNAGVPLAPNRTGTP